MNRFTLVSAAALIALSAGAAMAADQTNGNGSLPNDTSRTPNASIGTPAPNSGVSVNSGSTMSTGTMANGSGQTQLGTQRSDQANNGMSQQPNAANGGATSTGNASMGSMTPKDSANAGSSMSTGTMANGSGQTRLGNQRSDQANNGMSQQPDAANSMGAKGTAMDHGDRSMSSKSAMGKSDMGSKSRSTGHRLAESTPTERRMTTALNMLEANGYDHFSDFRSNGQGFQANVTDINGKSGIVNIDPDAGSVSQPQ